MSEKKHTARRAEIIKRQQKWWLKKTKVAKAKKKMSESKKKYHRANIERRNKQTPTRKPNLIIIE